VTRFSAAQMLKERHSMKGKEEEKVEIQVQNMDQSL